MVECNFNKQFVFYKLIRNTEWLIFDYFHCGNYFHASWSLDVVIGHDLETKLNEKYIYLLVFYTVFQVFKI